MICEYAVPIITTMDGPREHVECPCSTETRLYLEQMIDQGDAELTPIIDVPGAMEMGHAPVTHRIATLFGGIFHARLMPGDRELVSLSAPAPLRLLFEMVDAVEEWRLAAQRQVTALSLLEAEVKALRRHISILTEIDTIEVGQ